MPNSHFSKEEHHDTGHEHRNLYHSAHGDKPDRNRFRLRCCLWTTWREEAQSLDGLISADYSADQCDGIYVSVHSLVAFAHSGIHLIGGAGSRAPGALRFSSFGRMASNLRSERGDGPLPECLRIGRAKLSQG